MPTKTAKRKRPSRRRKAVSERQIWTDTTALGQLEILAYHERKRDAAWNAANIDRARVYFQNSVTEYDTDAKGHAAWIGTDRGIPCAFRGIGDKRPVNPWNLV